MDFDDKTIPNDGGYSKKDFVDSERGFDEPTFDGIKSGLVGLCGCIFSNVQSGFFLICIYLSC